MLSRKVGQRRVDNLYLMLMRTHSIFHRRLTVEETGKHAYKGARAERDRFSMKAPPRKISISSALTDVNWQATNRGSAFGSKSPSTTERTLSSDRRTLGWHTLDKMTVRDGKKTRTGRWEICMILFQKYSPYIFVIFNFGCCIWIRDRILDFLRTKRISFIRNSKTKLMRQSVKVAMIFRFEGQ